MATRSAQWRPPNMPSARDDHLRWGWLSQVGDGHWLVAARAVAAVSYPPAEQPAVRASAFVDVALFAFRALVDGGEAEFRRAAHRAPPSGTTPAPASAWESRTDSPAVWQT